MLKNTIIRGYIALKSGLHIGGNKDSMQIGGIDNPVIKNPVTKLPYVPGSSLKGKMRFLLEHAYGLVKDGDIPPIRETGGNANWTNNLVGVMFGHLEHKDNTTLPTRVIFRDGKLAGAIDLTGGMEADKINRDIEGLKRIMNSDFVEAKTEVNIDRINGTVSKKGGPRTIERVPAGTVFDFEVVLRLFEDKDRDLFIPILKKGLQLLQNDALGGSGSRGSGRIQFFGLELDGEPFKLDNES